MAEIRFRKDNTEYHLDYRSNVPCEQQLAFMYIDTTYYVPAMSTQGTKVLGGTLDGLSFYYDTSSPTIAFRKNDKTYYCSKSMTTERAADIPAGTYSPSAFKKLIESFISHNGSRAVKNDVSVTVNGQTVSISAGDKIHYTTQGSSPWYARAVGFGSRYFQVASCMDKVGFSNYKSYIVETSPSDSYTSEIAFNKVFRNYASFNITVNTGINFK